MITGELGAQLAAAVRGEIARGGLAPDAARVTAAGTWRPAPRQAGGGPGTYATSLPFALADRSAPPAAIAGRLADGLHDLPWVRSAQVTGGGYLTIMVTTAHLAGLPARLLASPQAAAASDALAGSTLTAPPLPAARPAPTWETAWREYRAAVLGRIASAAGAHLDFHYLQRNSRTSARTPQADAPVARALAYYGADAVRYAMARAASGRAGAITRQLTVFLDLANPFFAVRYAHANAASTVRWAADLGLASAAAGPARLTEPAGAELALLDAMSWLPERAASAARRRRPAELTGYLESLAASWLDCRESCPALPFGGRPAPALPDGDQAAARVALATATATVLSAGLDLLGVAAPSRL